MDQDINKTSTAWIKDYGYAFESSLPLTPETPAKLRKALEDFEAQKIPYFIWPQLDKNRVEIYIPREAKEKLREARPIPASSHNRTPVTPPSPRTKFTRTPADTFGLRAGFVHVDNDFHRRK